MTTAIYGQQRDWDALRQDTKQPIITIITSTFNAAADLPWTIESIKKQTYPYVQWIVADGASTDATVKLLKEHSDVVDIWFSEPDQGIYDAWNKALHYAKGDWIQFIGAGDELYEADTLAKVTTHLQHAHPKYDFVYGQVMHISEKGRQELYVSGEPWENYVGKWEGNRPALPVQTGIYHHKSVFNHSTCPFNTDYKITADCHFLLKKMQENKIMEYIPIIVNKMPMGGVSGNIHNGLKIYQETLHSTRKLHITIPRKVFWINRCKYHFTQTMLGIISEKKYGQLIDCIKVLRGKPKVFTIE